MCFFFFQAEDGIRYLVRSRGLGDVYKRQLLYLYAASLGLADGGSIGRTTLLAMAATALMLVYFDLRSRAFSPVLSEARLAALNGWDDTVYTHLSASVPGEPVHYLINRFGLMFDEVCASNLVKVDLHGRVVDGSGAKVNPSGFAIHGAVHAARPEVECVIHLHSPWGVALSMLPDGLQPTSQWAMRLHGRLGRPPYESLALGAAAPPRLEAALGRLTADRQIRQWLEWPADRFAGLPQGALIFTCRGQEWARQQLLVAAFGLPSVSARNDPCAAPPVSSR